MQLSCAHVSFRIDIESLCCLALILLDTSKEIVIWT